MSFIILFKVSTRLREQIFYSNPHKIKKWLWQSHSSEVSAGVGAGGLRQGWHKKNRKRGKLGMFYVVQITRIQENIHNAQDQRTSIKVAYRLRRSVFIAASTHMYYLLKTGEKTCFILGTLHISFSLLNSEFRYSI